LKKGVQKDYFKERIKGVADNLSHFVKDQNLEALHQMRVEAKKAHSLLKLQVFSDPDNKTIKYFTPIRKIFRQAGLIREAQLNLENLDSIQIQDEKMRHLLQITVEKETKTFLFKARHFGDHLKKSVEKTLKKVETMPDKAISDFFRNHLQLASKNLKRKLFINHLHESRKSLKVLIHLHELSPNYQTGELQLNWPYLDLFQDKIGKWHDMHRTELWMKKSKANKSSLKVIHAKLQEQLAEIRELKKDFEIKTLGLNGNGA
jgi:CHAD domain-containing protein